MAQPAIISYQHKEHRVDMATVSTRDVRLGQGVAAAVLHVAAAGARGSRELAMELDAARDAVDSRTNRGGYAAPFDASFSRHLLPRALAGLLQRQRRRDQALESLHAGVDLLQKDEPELLTIYGELVMVAADAAARVRTEEGLFGWHRVEYSERRALDQIRSIVAAPRGAWQPVLK
jgi:hypothetical protein